MGGDTVAIGSGSGFVTGFSYHTEDTISLLIDLDSQSVEIVD